MKSTVISAISLGILLHFFNPAVAAVCSTSGGKTVVSSTCQVQPNSFKITLFELAMCTAAPTAPTITRQLDSSNVCETIITDSDGIEIEVTDTVATSINFESDTTVTIPDANTFTHGYAKLSYELQIKYQTELSASFNGESSGSGTFCRTAPFTWYTDALDANGNALTPQRSICGTSLANDDDIGWLKQNVIDFNGPAVGYAASLTGYTSAGGTDNLDIYLIQSDSKLASNRNNANAMVGIQTFGTAKSIRNENPDSPFTLKLVIEHDEAAYLNDNGGSLEIGTSPFTLAVDIL